MEVAEAVVGEAGFLIQGRRLQRGAEVEDLIMPAEASAARESK